MPVYSHLSAAFFYSHRLSEQLWLGLATDSDFGLSGNYRKQWAGRYYVTQESLITARRTLA